MGLSPALCSWEIISVPEPGAGSLAVGPKHSALPWLECWIHFAESCHRKNSMARSQEHTSCTASGATLQAFQKGHTVKYS